LYETQEERRRAATGALRWRHTRRIDMQKTLFFCSRMAPFGDPDLRSELHEKFGSAGLYQSTFCLQVENRNVKEGEDARLFCARAIQSSDAIVLLLDGSSSITRSPSDAPVLELEVMLAAACAKPVFVLDGSNGEDPLFRLLGTEFFAVAGAREKTFSLRGTNHKDKIAHLEDVLAETCDGKGPGASALLEHVGWEKLFLGRPDRLDELEEDGGNFPFARNGLGVVGMMTSDIAQLLDKTEETFKTDKMASVVSGWDAIRALSEKPWGATELDRTIAQLWLRALKTWGGGMAWLGLFGHSSGAAIMANLACRSIASRIDIPETKDGGRFAPHKFLGGLASNYFSLSKLVESADVQRAMRLKGIRYSSEALLHANGPGDQAGLLAIRGPLFLATRTRMGVIRGFWDLRASVRLHKKASCGNPRDHAVATSRIQLGAAFKELAKYIGRDPVSLRLGRFQLEAAHDVLDSAHAAGNQVDVGQLLMCKKHLVETLCLLGRESAAMDLWSNAKSLAIDAGISDQLRQLRDIAKMAGWEET
jgi:hypothetical protein